MNPHVQGMSLPKESVLAINIHVTQPLNVTAFSARQRVTQYVIPQLSTQLGGASPDLTVGEGVYWSVPIVFTLPGKGVLGRVGLLRADAGTGELLTDPQTELEIMHVKLHQPEDGLAPIRPKPRPLAVRLQTPPAGARSS